MKAVELAKAYNPKDFEDRIYAQWKEGGMFKPSQPSEDDPSRPPFVIVIPPPNVTGVLHMGHGLNNSLQDILIRYHRMLGDPTLWVPGTDHAGIATQNVVERQLQAKGTSRHVIGREAFVEETWNVKDQHHTIISKQLEKIGASCDWDRERFTLDEGLSKAVREVFVALYEKGLIYKGNYLVNWCPACGTALADDEVEHRELAGHMYHITYPLSDGSGSIEIATTRPETMLGDVAVAVHPEDERYRHLVGKMIDLPLTGRQIPIIADPYVSMEFGTGMVKITPAHDPNDWDIGNRHDLEKINILHTDGTLNSSVPAPYRGLTVAEARTLIVNDLKGLGLFVGREDHTHQVGHCYRCNTVIEPFLSEQWFVRMQSMAQKALSAWEEQEVVFYPKKWENTYTHWMKNIRDWCISRQLWWGHRIPVWYCEECGEMMVCREDPAQCSACGSTHLRQEEDVLDTWFSSWLWPFSTLGWPEKSEDLKHYFPTSTLVTGYDIIFFWVARMIMASLEFMGEVPFRDIYITGLVRDREGRKMSKSLGNGIDPLEVVDIYGADAMKFTLCFLAAQGQDIQIDMESFKFGSRFANKIWNAARFLLMNLEGKELVPLEDVELKVVDQWIYHRLNETAAPVAQAMSVYRFNDASQAVYEFFWNDYCDWYIEASKGSLYSTDIQEQNRALSLMLDLLAQSMRLLHPFVSFITEEIYQKLPNTEGYVIGAEYPLYREQRVAEAAAKRFNLLQEAVKGVRTLRSEFAVPPEKRVRVIIRCEEDGEDSSYLAEQAELIAKLTHASGVVVVSDDVDVSGSVPVAGSGYQSFVFIRDAIDIPKEITKLEKEYAKLMGQKTGVEKKLANAQFLSHAPDAVVEKEQGKLAEFTERIVQISAHIELLRQS
ncbi:MAG: valine--tRNA ligase [Spirochaetia bacterium]|nr:valine--tRNA ligase [Spirochaetia bacterium]